MQQKGVIRMFNPRGKLVTIAQHGFQPIWLDLTTDDYFAAVPVTSVDEASICQLANGEKVFVLPISHDRKLIGQTIILIEPDWVPKPFKIEFMTNLARALSGLVNRCLVNETLHIREIELEDARTQALRRLGTASEYRDNETGMHVMRMTNIAVVIARALGLSEKLRELLFIAAPMHDVGKIGISDAILLKPGKLSVEEFDVMKSHTEIGERLLQGHDSLVEASREIAMCHHENWDGSGYPRGLKGEDIPVLARVCSLADVFDALTSVRPYKSAWSVEQAIAQIISDSGTKFDPAVVRAFEDALPDILRIKELYREDVINPNQVLNLPKPEYHDTRWVNWDESLSVGIDVIDEHHRYLFDLTNDLIDIMANKRGSKELVRVLNALEQYAQVHFLAEERMMQHCAYDGTERQIKQHKQFLDELNEFYKELHDNPLIAQIEVMGFLREWLVGHIRYEDTKLKALVAQDVSAAAAV